MYKTGVRLGYGGWNNKVLCQPFGEFCCNPIFKGQILCAQNGCDAKVHQWCLWTWLKKARLPVDYHSPVYCPARNIQRGDYIRWYFGSRKQPVPPDLLRD